MYPAPSTPSPALLPPSEWPRGRGKPGEPQAGPLQSPPLPSSSLGFGCPGRAGPFYRPVEPVGASLLTGGGKLGGGLALSSTLDSGEDSGLLVPGEEGEKETASFLVKKGTFFFFNAVRQDPSHPWDADVWGWVGVGVTGEGNLAVSTGFHDWRAEEPEKVRYLGWGKCFDYVFCFKLASLGVRFNCSVKRLFHSGVQTPLWTSWVPPACLL